MDPAALWVTLGGVALAVGVNSYFFSPRRAVIAQTVPPQVPPPQTSPATARSGEPVDAAVGVVGAPGMETAPDAAAPVGAVPVGTQVAHISVRGGYDPARIEVKANLPVRLVFRREEVAGCSDTVLIPEWGIARRLPAGEDTAVEFTPRVPGEYGFTCGMQMMRGTIVVV